MRLIMILSSLLLIVTLYGQPTDWAVFDLANSFDWLPGESVDIAQLHNGEAIVKTAGSFLMAGRSEYLIDLGMRSNGRTERLAFVAYEDESGTWQRSNWFKLQFLRISITDVDKDGMHELIHEVAVKGNRLDQYNWRLITIADDKEALLHEAESFEVHIDNVQQESLSPGDHIVRDVSVSLFEHGKHGYLAIEEKVEDQFFSIHDHDGDGSYHPARQSVLPRPEITTRIFVLNKHGEYELQETESPE